MNDAVRLAKALLMFYSSQWWTYEIRQEWEQLTGTKEATTVNLCNLAREILRKHETNAEDKSLPRHLSIQDRRRVAHEITHRLYVEELARKLK